MKVLTKAIWATLKIKKHYFRAQFLLLRWKPTAGEGAQSTADNYTGDNLTTKYTYEQNGDAKIEIG